MMLGSADSEHPMQAN